MLENDQHNKTLQNKIERFLFDSQTTYNLANLKKGLNFSDKTSALVIEKSELMVEYLQKMIDDYAHPKDISKLNVQETNLFYTDLVIRKLKADNVANHLLAVTLEMISKESNLDRLVSIEWFNKFGKALVNKYIFFLYNEYLKDNNEKISLAVWKSSNEILWKHIYDTEICVGIGGNVMSILTSSSINMIENKIEYNDKKELVNIIRITDKVRSTIITSSKVLTIPTKLPMISPPKHYTFNEKGDIELGGYLNNNVLYTSNLFIDKIGYRDTTKITKDNVILDLINGVSSVPYKINVDTLDYILLNGVEKGIITNINDKDVSSFNLNPYKKMTKKTSVQLRSKLSILQQEQYILNIAQAYSSASKIYFPVRLDQRTRLYCNTDFFNYQSNDLAKSLLLFANSGVIYKHDIKATNYLKSFGAILYDSSMSKKSIETRIKWVDKNKDYIINFENNDIIDKADDKASFVSFCFEYKRFAEFNMNLELTEFKTNLPIQLDASCNGYQHISLLTKEKSLFKELNLAPSTESDCPGDFYGFILIKIKERIEEKLSKNSDLNEEDLLSLDRIHDISFTRNIVKKALMTKSYNATALGMADYIINYLYAHSKEKEVFSEIEGKFKVEKYSVFSIDAKTTNKYVTKKDVFSFLKIFKEVLCCVFPRYKILNDYTKTIVKIFIKLDMAIPWTLPHGAIISQSYLSSKKKRIKPFSFINTRFNFRTILDKFDKVKQANAIAPNLIHSLDASSIALLYHFLDKHQIKDLYTIHDCFAVTANNVDVLIENLKGVYLFLYADSGYISKMDKHIRNTIINTFGNDKFSPDNKYVIISDKEKILYPSINELFHKETRIKDLGEGFNLIYLNI